jgi:Cys-tRNA(Pro)/Cys-tRNA(Cys) deacylase
VTPAVEAAKGAGIAFELHEYEGVEVGDGDYATAVAEALDRPPAQLYKTLVAKVDGDLAVFIIPADQQLDLRAVGKRAELYVVGGISPLGQRKQLPASIDASVYEWETILVSAGRRGLQIELAPSDLIALTGARVGELTRQ